MQRHASFTCRNTKCSLIFVSNIHHENSRLRSLPGYLHPEQADHYLWVDFLPVFVNPYKRDSLAGKLLADFGAALKANGMIGRTIKGASGSLYTYNSDASHLALRQLWDLLQALGFKLAKKSARETTIRAYPSKHKQYPLLNPRFWPTAAGLEEAWDRECCFRLHRDFQGRWRSLRPVPQAHSARRKHVHLLRIHLKLPTGITITVISFFQLEFVGKAASREIDFIALKQPLARMRDFLKGCKS